MAAVKRSKSGRCTPEQLHVKSRQRGQRGNAAGITAKPKGTEGATEGATEWGDFCRPVQKEESSSHAGHQQYTGNRRNAKSIN